MPSRVWDLWNPLSFQKKPLFCLSDGQATSQILNTTVADKQSLLILLTSNPKLRKWSGTSQKG